MSIYRYTASQVISQITFRRNEGGAQRAYLQASENVTPETLKDIQQDLSMRGYQCVPTQWKGQPVLEVRGFSKRQQLLDACHERQWTNGHEEHIVEKEDSISRLDQLRKRSLQAAGASFVVGDLAFMKYGYKGASPLDVAAGMAYSGGTLTSLFFGRKDPSDLHIKDISTKLAQFMRERHPELAQGQSLQNASASDQRKGVVEKLDNHLRHYPAELMNSFYAAAGVCIALASLRKMRQGPELQTFVNTAQRLERALESQVGHLSELKNVAPKSLTELHELIDSGLARLKRGTPLLKEDLTALERHTGELEELQKITRKLDWKPVSVDADHAVSSFEHEVAGKDGASAATQRLHVDKLKQGSQLHRHALAKTESHHKTENIMDIGLGLTTLTSGAFGTLVKEKTPDPDKHKENSSLLSQAWEWAQGHPLSITAAGYMVSTLCHAASTTIAHVTGSNERRQTVKWRATFVAANVLAEVLMSISSKGHGSGVKSDGSIDETILSTAAETIAQQPASMQGELIDYVAKFLGRPDVLAIKDKEVSTRLTHAVEAIRKNPWALAGQHAPAVSQPGSDIPAWQAKIATQLANSNDLKGPQQAV